MPFTSTPRASLNLVCHAGTVVLPSLPHLRGWGASWAYLSGSLLCMPSLAGTPVRLQASVIANPKPHFGCPRPDSDKCATQAQWCCGPCFTCMACALPEQTGQAACCAQHWWQASVSACARYCQLNKRAVIFADLTEDLCHAGTVMLPALPHLHGLCTSSRADWPGSLLCTPSLAGMPVCLHLNDTANSTSKISHLCRPDRGDDATQAQGCCRPCSTCMTYALPGRTSQAACCACPAWLAHQCACMSAPAQPLNTQQACLDRPRPDGRNGAVQAQWCCQSCLTCVACALPGPTGQAACCARPAWLARRCVCTSAPLAPQCAATWRAWLSRPCRARMASQSQQQGASLVTVLASVVKMHASQHQH